MNDITLVQQQPRQIRPILPGNARDQRSRRLFGGCHADSSIAARVATTPRPMVISAHAPKIRVLFRIAETGWGTSTRR